MQLGQAFKTTEKMPDEGILSLSWKIATDPKLYWELAPNPYSPRSQQIISARFPNESTTDVIRAVVLAEPEGNYDRSFGQLSKEQQDEELFKQSAITTEVNIRFVQYCNKYAHELIQSPKELVYDSLVRVIFETADLKKSEQIYAQSIRRDFKVAIICFIEDTQLIAVYSRKKNNDKKQQVVPIFFTVLSLILIAYIANGLYQQQTQSPEALEQTLGSAQNSQLLPVRLKIPQIKVDAAVEYIGLTTAGAMDVPENTKDVGWYKLGPSPGEKGNAVISGHFDGRQGKFGVFNNLDKLKQGDKLYIINRLGKTTTFIVRESRTYTPGYADEVFLPTDDGTHLNLITCDGVWDGDKKSYSKRLVVFADIIY